MGLYIAGRRPLIHQSILWNQQVDLAPVMKENAESSFCIGVQGWWHNGVQIEPKDLTPGSGLVDSQ